MWLARLIGTCLYFNGGLVPTNENCFKHMRPLWLLLERLWEQKITFVEFDISVSQTCVTAKGHAWKAESDGSTGSSHHQPVCQSASRKWTQPQGTFQKKTIACHMFFQACRQTYVMDDFRCWDSSEWDFKGGRRPDDALPFTHTLYYLLCTPQTSKSHTLSHTPVLL